MRLCRKHDNWRQIDMSKLNRLWHLLAAFLSLGAAFAILILAGLPQRSDFSGISGGSGRIAAPEVDSLAPSFALPTASSGMLALEQVRGTATIINFWATWCQPCRREMRDLQRLYDSYPGQLRVLAVNLGESFPVVRNWVAQLGITYDVLLDSAGAVSKLYQVRGLPTTYVLAGDHRIRRLYYGPLRLEQLREDLEHIGKRA